VKIAVAGVAVGAVALLAVAGRSALIGGKPEARPGGVARVVRRDIGSVVKATGVVRPSIGAEVRVGVQSPGVLRRLHVGIGDEVAKGQLLAELEAGSLRAKRDQAAAVVRSAQASLAFEIAELARKRKLSAEHVISRSELDLSERGFALAEAGFAQARANLDFARAQLEESRILSPIGGVVASIAVQEGEAVSAGLSAPALLTLIDLRRLETWAYVDETDIGRIRIGQNARFTVDAYPGQEIEGRVAAIHPKPEIRDNVVDYIVALAIAAPRELTLRPEMTANVKIALDVREGVLSVPRRAVRREQGRSFVLSPKGRAAERKEVVTGSRDEASLEIVDGLREGDEVLIGDLPAGTAAVE
jgi:macrolide-specific efflux system membrane fusion protein